MSLSILTIVFIIISAVFAVKNNEIQSGNIWALWAIWAAVVFGAIRL